MCPCLYEIKLAAHSFGGNLQTVLITFKALAKSILEANFLHKAET